MRKKAEVGILNCRYNIEVPEDYNDLGKAVVDVLFEYVAENERCPQDCSLLAEKLREKLPPSAHIEIIATGDPCYEEEPD